MRWGALALAAAVASACSTARIPRVGGDPPPAFTDGAKEHAYQVVLDASTRSQAVYDNLDTNVFFHATWQSPRFVEARVAREAAFRALPTGEAARALDVERARLADGVEFFLGVHANSYRFEDFGRPGSMWRLALIADGREVTPTAVERLGRTSTQLQAVYSYLEAFWVGYRVRFPAVALPPGRPFTFRLASPLGQADLVFTAD